MRHVPVLLKESFEVIAAIHPKIHVDATLGAGGHANHFLSNIPSISTFIGIDRDLKELENTRKTLLQPRNDLDIQTYHTNFFDFPSAHQEISNHTFHHCDSLIIDLGCSSMQLDDPDRGFSFRYNAPLDMRMDQTKGESAADLVMNLSQGELERIFWDYGEDRYGRLMARKICESRQQKPIRTTFDLLEAVNLADKRGKKHPATRLFQALRIAVNGELEHLKNATSAWLQLLAPKGRAVFITFHSLEDRIIKHCLKEAHAEGSFTLHQRKVIKVSDEEIKQNPRSRSAKLRWIERK